MSLHQLPTVLVGILLAMLIFALSLGFFAGRACTEPPPQPVDIHKERARIERELDAKKLELLRRSQKKSVEDLRKELLEGAGNAK